MNMSNKSEVLESQACNAVDDFSSRKIGSLDELSARLLPGNDSYLKSFRSRQMMEGLIVSSFGVNSDVCPWCLSYVYMYNSYTVGECNDSTDV